MCIISYENGGYFLNLQPKSGPDYMPVALDNLVDTFGLK